MATVVGRGDDIPNLVRNCVDLFDQIQDVLSERPGNQYQLILNCQQHFQAWMDRVGMLDQPSTGQKVELRLQTKPVILHLIRDLLNIIKNNLTTGMGYSYLPTTFFPSLAVVLIGNSASTGIA